MVCAVLLDLEKVLESSDHAIRLDCFYKLGMSGTESS